MGSFGERLQREREMRGITLEEIANATKIGTRSLRALEEEEFAKLPGGIFNKGFVRAYARYLGINEEQVLADYAAALGEDGDKDDEAALRRLEPTLRAEKERLSAGTQRGRPSFWTPVFAIAVVALCAGLAWRFYPRYKLRVSAQSRASVVQTNPQPAVTVPVPASPQSAVTDPPPPTTPATDAAVPSAPTQNPVEMTLVVHARQNCWVSIQADGKLVIRDILEAGSDTSVRARKQVVLTAGNAGGIEVSLNGKLLEPIGPADQVRTVVIGPEGVRHESARANVTKPEN
ncbi:MAG: helix-turn-helix domain-containing protein [Terriglobales bacterium]